MTRLPKEPPMQPEQEYVASLNPHDVLCGRGSGPNDHTGNIRFRQLVAERRADYMATVNRRQKAVIAKELVITIQDRGGRFLRGVNSSADAWCVVEEEVALEKVKQALRQHRGDKAAAAIRESTKKKHVASDGVPPTAVPKRVPQKVPQKVLSAEVATDHVIQEAPRDTEVPTRTAAVGLNEEAQEVYQEAPHNVASQFAAAAQQHLMPPPAVADPFEPIPVHQISQNNERMPSGLDSVLGALASSQTSTSLKAAEADMMPSSEVERQLSEERTGSLRLSDLVRTDPLQTGGVFEDEKQLRRAMGLSSGDMADWELLGASGSTTSMLLGGNGSNTSMLLETSGSNNSMLSRPSALRGLSTGTTSTKASNMSLGSSSGWSFDGNLQPPNGNEQPTNVTPPDAEPSTLYPTVSEDRQAAKGPRVAYGTSERVEQHVEPGAVAVYPEECVPQSSGIVPTKSLSTKQEEEDGGSLAIGQAERGVCRNVVPDQGDGREPRAISAGGTDRNGSKRTLGGKKRRLVIAGIALVVLIGIIVGVVVPLTAGGGSDDTLTTPPTLAPTETPTSSPAVFSPTVPVTVFIQLDRRPRETRWSLKCGDIFSREVPYFTYTNLSGQVLETLEVPEDSECSFLIEDSGGDGICCDSGQGFYEVYVGGNAISGELVAAGGEFGIQAEPHTFFATWPTPSPTVTSMQPTMSTTPSPTISP